MRKAIRSRLSKLERARRLLPMEAPLQRGTLALYACATYCLTDDSRVHVLALEHGGQWPGWPHVEARLRALVETELAQHFSDTCPPEGPDAVQLWAHRWTQRAASWRGPAARLRVTRGADWWRLPTSAEA